MSPCPERRILRKLLADPWGVSKVFELDGEDPVLHVEANVRLDPTELLVLAELLAD